MSLIRRTYGCDGGGEGEAHRFEIYLESGEHPKFCPQCGCEVDAEALPIPSKISIGGSAIARATDQTYRALEQSTAARAAELNAPSLKVTDMHDNLRHGDVAAKAPDNTVTQFSRETQERFGINYLAWGGGLGGRVAPVMTGDSPGAKFAGPGHVALAAIQPDHETRVQEVVTHPTHKPYMGG